MLEGPEGEGETTLGPHVSPLHVLRDNKREEQQVQICSAQHSEEENPCQLCNSTGSQSYAGREDSWSKKEPNEICRPFESYIFSLLFHFISGCHWLQTRRV